MSYVRKVKVPVYEPTKTYQKFDVVSFSGFNYYVSSVNQNLGNEPSTVGSSIVWKKFGDYNFLFNEVWCPSYETAVNVEPRTINSNIGGPYVDFLRPDGENTVLMNLEVTFERRSVREVRSLLAFLDYMGGKFMFRYDLPDPYNSTLNFICKQWNVNFISWEQQNLVAVFEQSATPFVFQNREGAGQGLLV